MLPTLSAPRLTGILAIGGLATAFFALPVAAVTITARSASPAADPCAVPIELSRLSAHDQGFVARRLLACSDLVHERITPSEYRALVHAIDEAWNAKPPVVATTQWASTVRSVSSQYSDSAWSASRVLGPPDVFPSSGDNANAWASLGADDRDEWIEVGFAQPTTASAVEVYETYNPGAVSSIELLSAAGTVIAVHENTPRASGAAANRLRADFGCTREPVASVRVRLASKQVAGWNELDAIGLVPCAQ